MVISWMFQVARCDASQASASISPISPTRLKIMAWRAAVLASGRVNHQPISIKDIMPTPSQPINS